MKAIPEVKAQHSLVVRRMSWGGVATLLLVLLALRTSNGRVLPVRALTATPLTCGNTNIAPGKPITARSSENSTLTPGKANDGNLTTRWSSQFSDPQWIQFDLGSTQVVCRVVLRWEAAYARAYQIQTSNDLATWTTIYSTTTGDGGVDDITGLRGSGRYLRIYMTQRATPYGYSLYEIEIYPAIWPTVTPPTSTRPCGGVITATPSATASPTRSNTVPPGTADDVVRTPTTCGPIVVTNTATTALPDLRVTRMYAELGPSDPARPPVLSTSSGGVSWTLRALRAGSVRFDVAATGEIYVASCNCWTYGGTSGSSGTVQVFPVVPPSACSGSPLYLLSGGALCKTPGGGATTNSIPSAGGANRDGTPTNPLVYTISGVGNLPLSTTAAFQLYVDAGSAVGNGVQAQVLYDYTGDGTWDRTETYNYFPTDPVAGWELYDHNRGLRSSSGALGTFMNGRIQLKVWSAIGNAPTLLRVSATSAEGRQSSITIR